MVELRTRFYGSGGPVASRRGDVTGFSPASRRRLFKFCAAINWELLEPAYFVTLTYPACFPLDGRRVKRDLDTFRKAWARRWGSLRAVWKLEFQSRGAPHFHLALAGPQGVELDELRAWVSSSWFRVVGSGDPKHLAAGTQVEPLHDNPAAYFAGYVGSSRGAKEYQHRVPEGFESVGRFWGAWGLRPEWREGSLTSAEFVALRRLLRASARASGSSLPSTGRIQSQWYHTRGRSAVLVLARLTRHGDRARSVVGRPILLT